MIRSIYVLENRLVVRSELLAASEAQPTFIWLDLVAATESEVAAVRERYGIAVQRHARAVVEEGDYLYMRATVAEPSGSEARFVDIGFVLGDKVLVTVSEQTEFLPFALAVQRLTRRPGAAADTRALLRALLQAVNDAAGVVIEQIADNLEETSSQIMQLSGGYTGSGRELGVSDLADTMDELNEQEGLVSRCVEAQLGLARIARHLSGEVDNATQAELQAMVNELVADIHGVKEHAAFEHDKVRYLQNAVTNILTIKQNQIVKVFTIITAVFLPPTLVATFYGMNFSVMPELSWEHGFTFSIFLTLIASLLPLIYIKRKGWLR